MPHEVDVVCGHAEELASTGVAHQVEEHAVTLQAALQILGVLHRNPKNKNYDGAVLDVTCTIFQVFQLSGFLWASNAQRNAFSERLAAKGTSDLVT